MDTGVAQRFKHVLLTGPPGIGKTTVCKKLVTLMEQGNYTFDGFYTEEIRAQNKRIGFDVVPVKYPEKRSRLARVMQPSEQTASTRYRVGNYNVFPTEFEKTAIPIFETNADVLLVDEIGKMEMFSKKFQDEVSKVFFEKEQEKPCVVATIPQMHKIPQHSQPLLHRIHGHGACKIIDVNCENRDQLPQEISRLVLQSLKQD